MRVRCEDCRAEYLLALSCKTRFFCPSCHAKRLACWTQWLGEELLAPVAHRQMVFVLPKRLRPYFQWRRKLLGDLARIAARTATDFVRATLNEPELSVGIALCIQTHGSLLNWQPHIHALVTDGGFRPDGSFVPLPAHATDALTEAFRRHDLRLFVERELLEPEVAESILAWTHAGFSVHDGVWLDQDDAAAHERLARTCARCPVSLERLEIRRGHRRRTSSAWWPTSPTRARCCGTTVTTPTARAASDAAAGPGGRQPTPRRRGHPSEAATVEPANFSRADARRWAVLIRRIYEVDPLVCPKCAGTMRMIALIQEPKVIDKILKHLRTKGRDARAGPWATGLSPPADAAAEAA